MKIEAPLKCSDVYITSYLRYQPNPRTSYYGKEERSGSSNKASKIPGISQRKFKRILIIN